ncbi:MAG TPA: hypothetical protein VMW75_28765 [Thermoanaerobaculia bacterium]|nr:hypothetical protein [Thermoanaerobaculia bacterium]
MTKRYVHGHHHREQERLHDRAGALVELLHSNTAYPRAASHGAPACSLMQARC